MNIKNHFLFFSFQFVFAFSFFSVSNFAQQFFRGDSVALGGGMVYSWIQVDGIGVTEAIGITMTESVLSNLPSAPGEFSLNLPVVASDSLFTHVLFDWNPQGHEPPGVYNLPHFDVHFYIVSVAEREAIVAGYDTFTVQNQFIPPDYLPITNPPFAVPKMGTHWIDTLSAEWQGGIFTRTFVYGYYHGSMYFIEPMITVDHLQTHPIEILEVKQPEAYQKEGYYPTNYSIEYDNNSMLFKIYIRDFVYSGTTSIKSKEDKFPATIKLSQNYPNPFNPTTTIKYQIPELSFVTLKVFDVLGNEIETLVNSEKPEGNFEITWNAESVPSGVYFYTLRAGNFVETRKMILMK
jgi:Secretion system C-terminal sorting domain